MLVGEPEGRGNFIGEILPRLGLELAWGKVGLPCKLLSYFGQLVYNISGDLSILSQCGVKSLESFRVVSFLLCSLVYLESFAELTTPSDVFRCLPSLNLPFRVELSRTLCLFPSTFFLHPREQVMDEIKVMSPASPSSRVPHPFLSGARPSSTPAAEERKSSARTSSPPPISTRGRLVGSSSASVSASSRIVDSRPQPRQQEEKQQQQQHVRRSLSPSTSPHQVTSPPTPAASAANTPCETPTTAVQQPIAPASSLPPSRHLAAVEEQSQQSASSPRASAAAADANEPSVDTKQERDEETPPVPVPGWALGYSTSAPFSSAATGTRGAGGEATATAEPTATAAAGSDSGAAPIGTAGHGVSDEAGEVLEELRGDDTAEDLVNVRAVLPVEGDAATGGRSYVGQRFIQAAEVRRSKYCSMIDGVDYWLDKRRLRSTMTPFSTSPV